MSSNKKILTAFQNITGNNANNISIEKNNDIVVKERYQGLAIMLFANVIKEPSNNDGIINIKFK